MSRTQKAEDMDAAAVEPAEVYAPPALRVLGSVHELTQGCDKTIGSTDGFTFMGQGIVCRST
jgi:hypothetical protein